MEKVDVVEIDMERSGIAREWKTDLPDVYFLERIEWKDTTMLVRRNGPSLSDRIYMVYKHHTTVLDMQPVCDGRLAPWPHSPADL